MTATLADRLWEKVDRSGGPNQCWPWSSPTSRHHSGAGRIWNGKEPEAACRVAWKVTFGEIPAGMKVLHSCDRVDCCNPDHLFLDSRSPVAMRKGARPAAKLKPIQVWEIRRMAASGIRQKRIAETFRISRETVRRIVKGETWR